MKPAGGWCDMTETAQLSASDEQPGDEFGEVSISGDGNTLLVGAPLASMASASQQVAPYVFVKPATVERFHELSKRRYMPVLYVAENYAATHENDEAFRYLEMAYREHAALMLYTKALPAFESIRSDPLYFDLLRRMKFPD